VRVRLGHVVFPSLIPAYCWIAHPVTLKRGRDEGKRETEREANASVRLSSSAADSSQLPASLEDTHVPDPFPSELLEEDPFLSSSIVAVQGRDSSVDLADLFLNTFFSYHLFFFFSGPSTVNLVYYPKNSHTAMVVVATLGIWNTPSCLARQLLQTIQYLFLCYMPPKKKPAVSAAYDLRQLPPTSPPCGLHL
jgi:hypothetical protein